MLKKHTIEKEELSRLRQAGYACADEEFIEYTFNEINNSIPKKEKFIRINSVCCTREFFYNFKLQTSHQCGFFYICPYGRINNVWKFLEKLCLGKKFSFFVSVQQEGVALLLAKVIDKNNIRLTLLNQRWYEGKFNSEKGQNELFFHKHTDNALHVNLDVIINKRNFIYTFYAALREIFNPIPPLPKEEKIRCGFYSNEEAQKESEIIRSYLGYIPATDKDLELLDLLMTFDLKKIEQALKNGANPNAIYKDNCKDEYPIIEEFLNRTDCFNGKRKVYAVIKLLVKYNAKPFSIYSAIYGNFNLWIVKHLIKNNCVFDDLSISDVSTDAWMLKNDGEKFYTWYEKLEKWYEELLFDVSSNYESTTGLFVPPSSYKVEIRVLYFENGKAVCPYCYSSNTATYVYGQVIMSDRLQKLLENKDAVLGGCCITPDSPAYMCNDCQKDFGIFDGFF